MLWHPDFPHLLCFPEPDHFSRTGFGIRLDYTLPRGFSASMNWMYWSVLSALFAGMTAVLAKTGVAAVDSNLATAVRTTVILVITWAVAAIFSNLSLIAHFPKRAWIFLTLSGVTAAFSWLCYFKAMQMGEASRVASVDKLSVIFAIVLAAIFLREQLTWQHCIGGCLIVLGALVISS